MNKLTATLLITLPLFAPAPADAQLFGKKSKTPPAQRVGELIVQAKSDPNDSKRAAAAEELREFDPKSFPEVVPVLTDLARSDKSANVRYEAIDSLSRLRPVTQGTGQTIEWAAVHDDSWKVRWHAKTALTRYQWAGYRAGKNDGKATPPSTQEPPLLDAAGPQTKAGTVSRTAPAKTSQPPALPTIVNQPRSALPKITQSPAPPVQQPALNAPVTPTPPPIIIDTPANVIAPAPKTAAPAVPVLDLGSPPPVPVIGTPPTSTEPNFRPAGQAPPRTPPPAKNDDRGPALTPPPM